MEEIPAPSITSYLGSLEDPRSDHTRRHKLIDIITIAICGVICGADSWVDLEIFGKSKEGWLKGFLELPNGIPSHDTFVSCKLAFGSCAIACSTRCNTRASSPVLAAISL